MSHVGQTGNAARADAALIFVTDIHGVIEAHSHFPRQLYRNALLQGEEDASL